MDIGNQQRVIIVETEQGVVAEPIVEPAVAVPAESADHAVAWPLPLDLDPEPVS